LMAQGGFCLSMLTYIHTALITLNAPHYFFFLYLPCSPIIQQQLTVHCILLSSTYGFLSV
jgi:hypothetical protein